jgi:hypothetical protein
MENFFTSGLNHFASSFAVFLREILVWASHHQSQCHSKSSRVLLGCVDVHECVVCADNVLTFHVHHQ